MVRNSADQMGRAERLAEELHFVGNASAQLVHADDDQVRGFVYLHLAVLRPILIDGLRTRGAELIRSLRDISGIKPLF